MILKINTRRTFCDVVTLVKIIMLSLVKLGSTSPPNTRILSSHSLRGMKPRLKSWNQIISPLGIMIRSDGKKIPFWQFWYLIGCIEILISGYYGYKYSNYSKKCWRLPHSKKFSAVVLIQLSIFSVVYENIITFVNYHWKKCIFEALFPHQKKWELFYSYFQVFQVWCRFHFSTCKPPGSEGSAKLNIRGAIPW